MNYKFMRQKDWPREVGFAHIIVLIAAVGLIAFLIISNSTLFQGAMFGRLFPKSISQAANIPGVTIIDASDNVVTQATNPTVRVQLTPPWPLAMAHTNSHGAVAAVSASTFQIITNADDVNEDGSNFTASGNSIFLGNGQSTSSSYTGLRFSGVTIPKGATITSAKLQVRSSSSQWISMKMSIAADKSANSATFSSSSKPSQRALTAAKVSHRSNNKWTANTDYSLNEIKSVIQEVVNQSGWNSGNALSVILKGTGQSWGRKYISSGNANDSAKLIVTYDTGGIVASSPSPTPAVPSPSPAPAQTIAMAVMAEDSGFTQNVVNIMPFTADPTFVNYTFSNSTLGTKTVYAKFTSSTGQEQTFNTSVQLVAPAVPSPSPTPTSSSVTSDIYGGPLADPAMIGTCSPAIHDKFVVIGPDGQLYRTWHPQKDPSGCTFAHEHGEDPKTSLANNELPAFGYIGKAINDLEPHPGFKVSVVNEGDRNDEGSTARYSTRIVFHMGTGGVKRYVMSMHSLQFDLIGQGRTMHVMGMADTKGVGSICKEPREGKTLMELGCLPDSLYEIWEASFQVSDKVAAIISMAAFDPITTRDPSDNTKLIYTKDTPSKWGGTWGNQQFNGHGCKRETYHGGVRYDNLPKDGALETLYTDAMGKPVAAGTGFKQVFSHSSGEIFSTSLIMTYKGGGTNEPMTQFKIPDDSCAPGLGLLN